MHILHTVLTPAIIWKNMIIVFLSVNLYVPTSLLYIQTVFNCWFLLWFQKRSNSYSGKKLACFNFSFMCKSSEVAARHTTSRSSRVFLQPIQLCSLHKSTQKNWEILFVYFSISLTPGEALNNNGTGSTVGLRASLDLGPKKKSCSFWKSNKLSSTVKVC